MSRNVYLRSTSCFFFLHLHATMQMTTCRCIGLTRPERQSRRRRCKRGVAPTSGSMWQTVGSSNHLQSRWFFLSLPPSFLFKCFLKASSQMDLWIKSNRSGKLTIWRVAALFICGFFWSNHDKVKRHVNFSFFFLHFAHNMFTLKYISVVFALQQCVKQQNNL